MNNIRTMTINDPFRAAFLLKYGRYKETRIENGQQCYVIEGDTRTLFERDFCFRTENQVTAYFFCQIGQ